MPLGLRIFVFAITFYGGIRLTFIGIKWLRELFDQLEPKKTTNYDDYD